MLSSKFTAAGMTLSAALMSACAWSSDPCAFPEFAADIERTQAYVEQAAPLAKSYGVLMGKVQRACVVLSFDISENGVAEAPRLEASYPNSRLERTALTTLSRYRFIVPRDLRPDDEHTRFFLSFEDSVEKRGWGK